MAFPPVANAEHRAFTLNALSDLGIRHIRIEENWTRRPLRPTPADFAPLKKRIDALNAGGLRVLLTVASDAPKRGCATSGMFGCAIAPEAPFDAYLTTLLNVVGDDIDAIQFGNEWDHQFPAGPSEFLALQSRFADVVRSKTPQLKIVLGGITGRAPYAHVMCERGQRPALPDDSLETVVHQFCVRDVARNAKATAFVEAVLSQADYDVVDVHLYDAPGLWAGAVDWVRARSRGPIWVTEFGGPNPEIEPQDEDYQAKRLKAYMAAITQLPVARVYYFKLTDDPASYHNASGLFTRKGQRKPAYDVFKTLLPQ